jgi:hypothetical protein
MFVPRCSITFQRQEFVIAVATVRLIASNMISSQSSNPHEVLASEKLTADRKRFFIDLKENARGRFFKITEDVGGRRDTIMLPIENAQEFVDALQRLLDVEQSLNGS